MKSESPRTGRVSHTETPSNSNYDKVLLFWILWFIVIYILFGQFKNIIEYLMNLLKICISEDLMQVWQYSWRVYHLYMLSILFKNIVEYMTIPLRKYVFFGRPNIATIVFLKSLASIYVAHTVEKYCRICDGSSRKNMQFWKVWYSYDNIFKEYIIYVYIYIIWIVQKYWHIL